MKIKIEGILKASEDIVEKVLSVRGLPLSWLTAGKESLLDGATMRNFKAGWDLLEKHQEGRTVIIIDNDADGITSFATMYQWLKLTYPKMDVSYVMALGKTHGIVNKIMPDPADYDLLIIPDASSSEIDKHQRLHEQGIDILVLDHHEVEQLENPYAVIINPHHPECPYENKGLSGVGVVYKFIETIDQICGDDNHTQFLDLVATGMVADVMSMKPMENKALINLGLANVQNPYIAAYLKADGRIKDKPFTPMVVGWYLAPQINALIRMGTVEDKLELCQAMIGEIDPEVVVAKIISIKGKQDRKKEPIFTRVVMDLQRAEKDTKNILVGTLPKHSPNPLTGLIAGQLSGAYQKPVLLGRVLDDGSFGGSLRSINGSSVENLKDFCEESGLFNWVAGHQAAAGFNLPAENVDKFIEYAEKNLPKVEKYFTVWTMDGDKALIVSQMNELEAHYGNGFEEILIYDEVYATKENTAIIGAKQNVFKVTGPGMDYLKFRHSTGLPQLPRVLGIVGTPNENEWNGMVTPQLFIKDWIEKELDL